MPTDAPTVAEAAAALRHTIAAYHRATYYQGIDRPLFWHVDGMRQARALLAALDADGGSDDATDTPSESDPT